MPPEDETRPATLRPEVGLGDGGAGYNAAPRPTISTKEQGVDAVSSAKSAWLDYQLRTGADETGGRIKTPMWVPDKSTASSGRGIASVSLGTAEGAGGGGGEYKDQIDPEGQRLYNRWQILESDNKQFRKDNFISDAGAGAGRSYVDTEGDKQDEVTRQFKDFLARAKGTYDLMDSERSYAMAGDDQNIQNQAAMRAGNLGEAWATPYADMRGPGLSSTLARSLPNYLSPDYRMNQAVGLGGPEGFDNANYDENGMPMYADGTDPAMANIPPELLAMVGKPMGVPLSSDFQPRDWPWGRIA